MEAGSKISFKNSARAFIVTRWRSPGGSRVLRDVSEQSSAHEQYQVLSGFTAAHGARRRKPRHRQSDEYTRRARAFLLFLHDGVADMLESNPSMKVGLAPAGESADGIGELRVFVSDDTGTYTFHPDVSAQELVTISPSSRCVRARSSQQQQNGIYYLS